MPANVTIRTNAGDVMNALSVKANTIRDNMDKSAEKIAKMALQEAKRLSSGSMSYRTMAKRGHPYSRKNPTTSTPWKGIWNFWDFTNCTKRFIIPYIHFQTYCQGCVR